MQKICIFLNLNSIDAKKIASILKSYVFDHKLFLAAKNAVCLAVVTKALIRSVQPLLH